MEGSQESAPPCPAQKPLERSSYSKQQSGKQMGGRGQHSLAKSHALPLNYSETETGWHSLQYCLSLNLSRQYVTLGKGQPQRAAECQLPEQHGAHHRAVGNLRLSLKEKETHPRMNVCVNKESKGILHWLTGAALSKGTSVLSVKVLGHVCATP